MLRMLVVMIVVLNAVTATVHAEDISHYVGLVKTSAGDAAVLREGRRTAVKPGYQLLLGDVLSTGPKSSMGVILRDDTILSIGSSTETNIEQFVYEPANQKLGMVLRMTHGITGYLSGKIAKLAPGSVRLETPGATLGVRGTYLVVSAAP